MILFRTSTGVLLARKPAEQFFTGPEGERYYTDQHGLPFTGDGTTVAGTPVSRFSYDFEEYVAVFPEAEKYRNWLTWKQDGTEIVLLQTFPGYSCMPGGMYVATRRRRFDHPKSQHSTPPTITVNDGDDFDVRKVFATEDEAQRGLAELRQLAPFTFDDLLEFGYERY